MTLGESPTFLAPANDQEVAKPVSLTRQTGTGFSTWQFSPFTHQVLGEAVLRVMECAGDDFIGALRVSSVTQSPEIKGLLCYVRAQNSEVGTTKHTLG